VGRCAVSASLRLGRPPRWRQGGRQGCRRQGGTAVVLGCIPARRAGAPVSVAAGGLPCPSRFVARSQRRKLSLKAGGSSLRSEKEGARYYGMDRCAGGRTPLHRRDQSGSGKPVAAPRSRSKGVPERMLAPRRPEEGRELGEEMIPGAQVRAVNSNRQGSWQGPEDAVTGHAQSDHSSRRRV
jgi:hypothetical protein